MLWSSLSSGSISFDPFTDVLEFDGGLSAADITVTFVLGTSGTFSDGVKTVTLLTAPETLTTTNITFQDSSEFQVGDNTTGTTGDSSANTRSGTAQDDQLVGLGGADTLQGNAGDDLLRGDSGNDILNGGTGNDTAFYSGNSAGYNFRLNNGNIVITDTDAGNGSDGADTLIRTENASFSDGSVRVVAGGETRVNTATADGQDKPAIATLSDGGYVISWSSNNQDGSGAGVYAQRYGADGEVIGDEFRVNTTTANSQNDSAIAGLGDGGFVVVWASISQDDGGLGSWGVYGQRYDAFGASIGGEFLVNNTVINDQFRPSVVALPDDGFVVVWDFAGGDIYARRFDGDGVAVGAEFLVNTTATNAQYLPAVGRLSDGGFVVAWNSLQDDASYENIYARRFDSTAAAVGGEFRVNTAFSDTQVFPAIAGLDLPGGGFVAVWQSYAQEGSGWGIYAQRYGSDGIAAGAEFRVSTSVFSNQTKPSVAALSDGGFVVTWVAGDAGSTGVLAQRFDAFGETVGGEFVINPTTSNDQTNPVVAGLSDGGFIATWESSLQDGSGTGIYAQRYSALGDPLAAELTGDAGNNVIAWSGAGSLLLDGGAGDDTLAGGSGDDALDGGTGADSMAGGTGNDHYTVDDAGDVVTESGAGTDHVLSSVSFTLAPSVENLTLAGGEGISGSGNTSNNVLTGNGAANSLDGGSGSDTLIGGGGTDTLSGGQGSDHYFVDSADDVVVELASQGTDTVRSTENFTLPNDVEHLVLLDGAGSGTGNALNNSITGNEAANTLSGGGGSDTLDGAGGEDVVTYTGDASGYGFSRVGGNLVVTDIDGGNGNDGVDTLMNVENVAFADGSVRVGWPGEFQVSDDQSVPSVATLADGSIFVIWSNFPDVLARHLDASGVATGAEFKVNSSPGGSAVVAALQGGDVVAAWTSTSGVSARRYDANGEPVGGEFVVNTGLPGGAPAIVGLSDGGFAVAWMTYNQDESGNSGIFARRYDAAGVPAGGEFQVNTTVEDEQSYPTLAALSGGKFVVVWESNAQDGDGHGIFAQRFDAVGDPVGGEFQVNTETANYQFWSDAAGLSDGGFVVAWGSDLQDGSLNGVYAQRFDSNGAAAGGEFRVNSTTQGDQYSPSVTGLANGGFVITWHSLGGSTAVFGQSYDDHGIPVGTEFRASTTSESNSSPDVTALPDGGFMLTWGQGGVGGGIHAQRFDVSGNPVSTQLAGDAGHNALTWTGASNVLLDGGAGNDALAGGPGNDFLTGGAGIDSLAGGAGDDTYIYDGVDVLSEASGAGTDTVRSDQSHTLAANFENLVLTGGDSIDGTGNGENNFITGNSAVNVLDGGAGNDTLNGAGGSDTLMGGSGNDLFIVDSAGDAVVEVSNQGADTIQSGASYTLPDYVEDLVLLDGAVDGGGNALHNTITGNDADNSLTGGAGNDTLDGAGGEDAAVFAGSSTGYSFGLAAGGFVVTGGDGTDLLQRVENASFADGTIGLTRLGEPRVNTTTANDQSLPAVATLADGGYVIVWQSNSSPFGSPVGVFGQRYDTQGDAVGSELLVASTTTFGNSATSSVSALLDGGFVVSWSSQDNQGLGIYAQRYDAAGNKEGAAIDAVDNASSDSQQDAAIATLTGGGFVLVWQQVANFNIQAGIYGQRYNADGDAVGSNFRADSLSAGNSHHSPAIAALPDGGYVVAWVSLTGSDTEIHAKRYDDTGVVMTAEFTVNTTTANFQFAPAIGALADGGFIVTWESPDADGYNIYAQRYAADGTAAGIEFRVNSTIASNQSASSVASLADGGFVISWSSNLQDGSEFGVYLQRYAADGTAMGAETRANSTTANAQGPGAVSALPDGGFVVTWQSHAQDGSGWGVYAQRFDASGNPAGVHLVGDAGGNAITWTGSANAIIEGGLGSDTIEGGAGDDFLTGDAGVDTASYTNAAGGVTVDLSLTAPQATGAAGVDMLVEFEQLSGSAFGDRLAGNAGANRLSGGDGSDTLVAGAGSDTLDGGAGSDFADFSGFAGPLTANIGEGGTGGFSFVSIEGVIGTAAADTLIGDGADNVLDGRGGVDSMTGADGNDRYVVDSASDQVNENPGEGVDQIDSSLSLTLPANVEILLLTGTGSLSGTGNGDNNVITGNSGANTLDGGAGSDTLTGGGGNDLFASDAGEGTDLITDYSGGDAIRVAGLSAVLPFTAGSGAAAALNHVEVSSAAGVTTLYFGMDSIAGADFSLQLAGTFTADRFRLNAGDIVINDAPVVNAALLDRDAEEDSAFSYVFAANSFADPNGDTLVYAATKADGSALPGWLGFNPGTREFSGTPVNADVGFVDIRVTATDPSLASFSDVFRTTVANTNDAPTIANPIADQDATEGSLFSFQLPADVFFDADLGDTLFLLNVDTPSWLTFSYETGTFSGTPDNAAVGVNQVSVSGIDAVHESVTDSFDIDVASTNDAPVAGNIPDPTTKINNLFSLATASFFSDVDVGDTRAYTAKQTDGSDLPLWLGFDTLTGAFSGTPLAADLGAVNVRVTMTDFAGASANDTFALTVNFDAEYLEDTLPGAHTLDGGTGADTMVGNDGNDFYIVDNGGDVVIETSNVDTDEIRSSVSYTLPGLVEVLVLTGTDHINGTGNTLGNQINGNSGDNVLDGGAFIDQMRGGGGSDTYKVDNENDFIEENPGAGLDRVDANVTYVLPANVENLLLTGSAPISGTGNGDNNVMTGNDGANSLLGGAGSDSLLGGNGADTLDGGPGNDSMEGGEGDDTYFVDSAGDVVTELLNQGTDRVHSSVSYTLGANQERLFLDGADSVDGTGNILSNQLFGNSGANVLTGLGGDDLLDGNAGADTMAGGEGNDVYFVDDLGDRVLEDEGGGSADRVVATVDFTLPDDVESLTILDAVALSIIGNDLDNFFQGADGNETFSGGGGDDTVNAGDGDNSIEGGEGIDVVELSGTESDYFVSVLSPGQDERTFYDPPPGFGLQPGDIVALANQSGRIDRLVGVERVRFLGNPNTTADDVELDLTPAGILQSAALNRGNSYKADINNLGTLTGGAGNDVLDGLGGADTLAGLGGADVLLGGLGNDRLEGGDGNDALNGQAGDDTLVGGAGNDNYIVDSALDQVIEGAAMGTADRVQSLLGTYSLAGLPEIEILAALAAGNFFGTGNAAANLLIGKAGSDTLEGGSGNDTLIGASGNDVLDGGSGIDRLQGGTGNDRYVVDDAADVVDESGGGGVDTVVTTLSSFDLATLGSIENLIYAGSGSFSGQGNALANRLQGGAGNDTLDGGSNIDLLLVSGIREDYAFARLPGGINIVTIATGETDLLVNIEGVHFGDGTERALTTADLLANTPSVLADTLTGTSGDDYLAGLAGNDTLIGGAGHDRLIGGAGNDVMSGGAGNDRYELDSLADVVSEALGAGTDTVVLTLGTAGNYTLAANVEVLELGGTANVNATGNALANRMTGNSGNNSLAGGAGNDTYVGGAGNDTYSVVEAGDSIDGSAGDAGVDSARVSVASGVAGGYLYLGDKDWLENVIYVGAGAVTITGNDLDNALSGAGGNDMLLGGAGNDVLDGGTGTDAMDGGAGDDTYVVNALADQITDSEGVDTVVSLLASYTLLSGSVIENVRLGGAALNATGNEGDNRLEGNALANVLTGGAGNDTLVGAGGNDRYVVDSLGDVVIETIAGAAGGVDTVQASVDFDLGGTQIEHALLLLGAGDALSGNALANQLTGAGNNDTLQGLGGNDTLTGNAGNDWLEGGAGNDVMSGGAGNDRYELDSLADAVNEALGAGTDTVVLTLGTASNFTLAVNVEVLELAGTANVNATGNALANRMTGNSGNNSLAGGAGNDTYVGGAGNDTYSVVEAGDSIDGSAGDAGVDSARVSVASGVAGGYLYLGDKDWLENVIYVGAGAVTITGNDLDNALSGAGGNDMLLGGAGNDVLDGGTGTDAMDGGAGDDTYVVNALADQITDSEGVDTVVSLLASYTLLSGSVIENVRLGGAALNATGNEGDNRLEGNALANVLTGGAGNDTLVGAGGNDRYVVDSLGDVVIETIAGAAGGVDTVQASVDFDLGGTQIEHALLLLGAGDALSGNALANQLTGAGNNDTLQGLGGNDTLTGNAGNDWLEGGAGNDVMSGGAGNDRYELDSLADAVNEALGAGTDMVVLTLGTASNFTLAVNVEVLELAGTANVNATGNALANRMTGNSGNNSLAGGAGNDTLEGGAGTDTLSGGSNDDLYVLADVQDVVQEALGAGTDSVLLKLSSGSHLLAQNVEHATVDASAGAIGVTGNGLANVLTGNQQANLLAGAGGNDSLNGGAGNDTLEGGSGIDTALYSGGQADYAISEVALGVFTVTGPDGSDQVSGVEMFRFGGGPAVSLADLLASQSEGLPQFALDALHSGGYWNHTPGTTLQLSFSFMTAAPSYANTAEQASFAQFTIEQKAAVRDALDLYETLIDVQFTEVSDANGGVDLRFGRNAQSEGSAGYAYLPGETGFPAEPGADQAAGDVWLNSDLTAFQSGLAPGEPLWSTLLHEIGHALGLKHPFDEPSLAQAGQADKDSDRYTVMSYDVRPDSGVIELTGDEFDWSSDTYNWLPETPMLYDIGALQSLYGVNDATAAVNDTYILPSDRPYFMTLWDAGGIDGLDASAFSSDSVIDLREGAFSSIGRFAFSDDDVWLEEVPAWYSGAAPTYGGDNLAIAFGTVIENASGGGGDDLLIGNAVANQLAGGAGNDSLRGGAGSDTLDGGADADHFEFDSLSGVDTIVSFAAGDRLVFDNAVFVQFAAEGALAAGAFRSGAGLSQGGDADDRVVFDSAGGGLYYDADGAGGASSMQVAQLTAFGALSAADILVA